MILLVALTLWAVYAAAWVGLRGPERLQPPRWGSIALWCAVALPSLLQFAVPGMLEAGRRESSAIVAGQWWRLLTSMVLQDGGWPGTLFNLTTLGVTLLLVQPVVRPTAAAALFLVGGLVGNVLTVLTVSQTGAGNSMATMFLAVTALAFRPSGGARRPVVLGVLTALTVVLLLHGDIHGLALAAALVVTAVLVLRERVGRDAPSQDQCHDRSMDDNRIVSVTAVIDAPAEVVFEQIADPANQPAWDGNDNLAVAEPGQRVRAVGEVFTMTLTKEAMVRENHVVEFEEGRLIAWRPAEVGAQPPGHLWRWRLRPLEGERTEVTHTYDWSQLADERRLARARRTTPERLMASVDRLARVCTAGG